VVIRTFLATIAVPRMVKKTVVIKIKITRGIVMFSHVIASIVEKTVIKIVLLIFYVMFHSVSDGGQVFWNKMQSVGDKVVLAVIGD
jgi:drug/metabolite transporter (DMT)-like permease